MPKGDSRVARDLAHRRMKGIYDIATRAESDPHQEAILSVCYSDVAGIADGFSAAHLRVMQEAPTENFDEEDQLRVDFDKMLYSIKVVYHALKRRAAPPLQPPADHRPFSNIKLPKISLPQFSGDLTLWPSFIALYNNSIHNARISDIEKYQYLLASLTGDALNVVKNLPFSPEHYAIAYDLLTSRYQNRRKLATHYWRSLTDAKPLKEDSAILLRKLLDTFNENVRALELMKFPTGSWDFILLNMLLDKLTFSLREKFEAEHRKAEIPTFAQLTEFLNEYCRVLVSVSPTVGAQSKMNDRATKSQGPSTRATPPVSSFVTNTNTSCLVCNELHAIATCPRFLALSTAERHLKAKELRLCLNCLRIGHRIAGCPSLFTCRSCNGKHHTLLHFDRSTALVSETASGSASGEEAGASAAAAVGVTTDALVSLASLSSLKSVVLLSTVRAEIFDARGKPFPVRILLDCASQTNFVTESCVQRGGFRRTQDRRVIMAVNDTKAATARGSASFTIQVNRENIRIPVTATILSRISSQLPNSPIEKKSWAHLKDLMLADPEYYQPGAVDILLGAEMFVSLLREGQRKGGEGEPDAFNTVFGWVLMGTVSATRPPPLHSFVTTLESIDTTLNKFWQIEEIPDYVQSDEDKRCEQLFVQSTRRDSSGRFVVSYPFSGDPPGFANTRVIAIRRFRSLERRFRGDEEFKLSYHRFMRDYLEQGHMELVGQPFPDRGLVNYLPHHGVMKLDSETTKLRVVFDASSKDSRGISLNQTLMSGPKLQQDIIAILLRFRIGPVALTADVRQMFRQIWLDPAHRDIQRIVWRFAESDPLTDYRLTTVTFGVTPSPYLAIRCLLQLAEEGENNFPLASAALRSSLYVDDIVASVGSLEEAGQLRDQLQRLLRGAGFELRKWASSHPTVLSDLEPGLRCSAMLSFDSCEDQFLKILGLRWQSLSDSFGFRVNPLNKECTKRTILSELARIFDPLGFLAPLTFAAKRLIQRLWTLGLDWDDIPPAEICRQWDQYKAELVSLASLKIPRSLTLTYAIRIEIHGFCDASEQGYGAVVYLRIVTPETAFVRLLCAKSKVAPLKAITLPRLELCGAVLLSELIAYVHRTFSGRVSLDAVHAWTDSMVALCWIRAEPQRWKTFVRNRVARIQERVPPSSWGHVSSESNPADHCSRGLSPHELVNCEMWWSGPDWIREFKPRAEPTFDPGGAPEEESRSDAFTLLDATHIFDTLIARFSSLDKVCRIVAYCLRFCRRSRGKPISRSFAIDQVETYSALLYIIKFVQSQCFTDDIAHLATHRRVSHELRKLSPFLDTNGVLRVGGRITHSALPYDAKHPALLPNRHRLTELIVEQTHRLHLHPGRRATQYLLSQKFWILGVHRAVRRVLANCYRCFRADPRPAQPFMADLPAERVNQVKPFSVTGVDYAGPFSITSRRARGATSSKMYVCLFVCFAVKAIHLELAFSLSTESFLAALRRFIARRGRCSLIFSDCGTNFVGAQRELAALMKEASEQEKLKWSFNPPAAPHFGGLWEAGVKSMKTHLKRVVGDQVLSVEEFCTVLAQVEAVLNSRPLCPLSSDPNDLGVLSPGHFLTFEPLVSLPSSDLTLVPLGRLGRWQLVQRMLQDFWKRWHQEYLHTLQQRPKWLKQTDSIQDGTLVLLRDDNASPLHWRRGRVIQLHAGPDGASRVATVKTAEGSLVRPLVKLCPLPMGQPLA